MRRVRIRIGAIAALVLAVSVLVAAISAHHASAWLSANGGANTPDHLPPVSGSDSGRHKSGTLTVPGSFTATYTENVYSDPNNTLCHGCLIWVVSVTNSSSSTDAITRVTIARFGSFIVDLGDTTSATPPDGLVSGTQVATTVDRSTNGDVLGWNFSASGAGALSPGKTSVLLEAETNAPAVTGGFISAIDAQSANDTAFAPILPEVPMVAGIGLLGGALVAGFAYRRRQQNKAEETV
jgi:hypothetical protein